MRQCRIIYEYFLPNNYLLKANNGNTNYMLFIKPGIQERGTECEECAERGECLLGFRGISQRIPGNVIILTFQGMFHKIPGNVRRDSGECPRRFRGMFERIPGNLNLDLFCDILLIFYQILQVNCQKNKGIFSALLITTYN